MFYAIENGKVKSVQADSMMPGSKHQIFGLIDFAQIEEILPDTKLNIEVLREAFEGTTLTYENHDGFDLMCLNISNPKTPRASSRVCICIQKDLLLFFSRDVSVLSDMMSDMTQEGSSLEFDRILTAFFEKITAKDADRLEKIETEISNLEDALMTSVKKNSVREIISLRKRLMGLKRYYEQLLDALDILQENENNLIDNRTMRFFKIFAGRVDRLYHSVLNLRDYVTQVREAYQAEVDISLNSTMKIFTVITAIFLPLSLIVGWYGMNVQMPEYKWSFGYPMVIILSAAVVVFCLVYFKKKKWF